MSFTARAKRVTIGALAAVTFAGVAFTLGTAVPAAAATSNANPYHLTAAQEAASKLVTHPGLDWLGSTIPAHEHDAAMMVTPHVTTPSTPLGLDVSSYQGDVNWSTVAADGAKFAYVKATENTNYTNPDFAQQYNGSYNAGLIRGAYHFATPNTSSGSAQADYFVAHGGGWSADGKTLPGMLDIEYNPYSGGECYGLSASSMVSWILSFSNEYESKTGRWPVIYSTTDWWSTCTGNKGDFSSTNPLMIANYNGSPGTLPYHWSTWTIWQWADSGTFPGDQDTFNGNESRIQALAKG